MAETKGNVIELPNQEELKLPKLKPKHEEFLERYISCNFQGTKAWKETYPRCRSNHAAHVDSSRKLSLPESRRYLSIRIRQIEQSLPEELQYMNRQKDVIHALQAIAYTDLNDICSWDENGTPTFVASHDLSETAHKAIRAIKVTRKRYYRGREDYEEVVTTELKMHDKIKAQQLLGMNKKMFTEVVDTNTPQHAVLVPMKRQPGASGKPLRNK
jgi:Terminase small subunit